MTKKSASKTPRKSTYTFTIEINGGNRTSRTSKRTLTYPKPPQRWTGLDLVKVVRMMARTAAEVRRKKVTERSMTVWFDALDGGTEITVSPTFGAWAYLRGHEMYRRGGEKYSRVHPQSIGVFVAMSQIAPTAHVSTPAMLPVDTTAFVKLQNRLLRAMDTARANIEAEIAAVGA